MNRNHNHKFAPKTGYYRGNHAKKTKYFQSGNIAQKKKSGVHLMNSIY